MILETVFGANILNTTAAWLWVQHFGSDWNTRLLQAMPQWGWHLWFQVKCYRRLRMRVRVSPNIGLNKDSGHAMCQYISEKIPAHINGMQLQTHVIIWLVYLMVPGWYCSIITWPWLWKSNYTWSKLLWLNGLLWGLSPECLHAKLWSGTLSFYFHIKLFLIPNIIIVSPSYTPLSPAVRWSCDGLFLDLYMILIRFYWGSTVRLYQIHFIMSSSVLQIPC